MAQKSIKNKLKTKLIKIETTKEYKLVLQPGQKPD